MIFITGGSGFVGRALIRRLLESGKAVRALYRDGKKPHPIRHLKLTWVRGEVNDREGLLSGMTGADAVVHLAGTLIEPSGQTFEKVHVAGTETVLEAAGRAGVRRFLYMSALGSRPDAASRYHRTKWRAEESVRRSGLQTTIFRPSLIFGKEDVSINRLAGIISSSPVIPVFGSGRNRLQPVWVEDVAESLFRSLDLEKSLDQTYALCGPTVYTMNRLIDLILEIKGIKKSRRIRWPVPIGLLKGPAALAERLFQRPPLTRDQLLLLQEENFCSDDRAGRDLGVVFRGPEEILPTYLR